MRSGKGMAAFLASRVAITPEQQVTLRRWNPGESSLKNSAGVKPGADVTLCCNDEVDGRGKASPCPLHSATPTAVGGDGYEGGLARNGSSLC